MLVNNQSVFASLHSAILGQSHKIRKKGQYWWSVGWLGRGAMMINSEMWSTWARGSEEKRTCTPPPTSWSSSSSLLTITPRPWLSAPAPPTVGRIDPPPCFTSTPSTSFPHWSGWRRAEDSLFGLAFVWRQEQARAVAGPSSTIISGNSFMIVIVVVISEWSSSAWSSFPDCGPGYGFFVFVLVMSLKFQSQK